MFETIITFSRLRYLIPQLLFFQKVPYEQTYIHTFLLTYIIIFFSIYSAQVVNRTFHMNGIFFYLHSNLRVGYASIKYRYFIFISVRQMVSENISHVHTYCTTIQLQYLFRIIYFICGYVCACLLFLIFNSPLKMKQ